MSRTRLNHVVLLMGAPEDYTAQHVATAPTLPYDRSGAPIRIETEADVQTPPEREWDADDDGRDCG